MHDGGGRNNQGGRLTVGKVVIATVPRTIGGLMLSPHIALGLQAVFAKDPTDSPKSVSRTVAMATADVPPGIAGRATFLGEQLSPI